MNGSRAARWCGPAAARLSWSRARRRGSPRVAASSHRSCRRWTRARSCSTTRCRSGRRLRKPTHTAARSRRSWPRRRGSRHSRGAPGRTRFSATEQNTGDFSVGLTPFGERKQESEEIIDGLRERIGREVPQLDNRIHPGHAGHAQRPFGAPQPIEVKIFGADYRTIQNVAGQVATAMEATGLVDVVSGFSYGAPELTYQIDSAAAGRVGLNSADLTSSFTRRFSAKRPRNCARATGWCP